MAVPVVRDASATAAQLERFLAANDPAMADVSVTLLESPVGTGFSSESLPFDATYTGADGPHHVACVARVRPHGYTLYQDHDLDAQWRVIDTLGRAGIVPLPRIIGHTTDDSSPLGQPFFVMERITGVVPSDNPSYAITGWLRDASPAEQRRVYTGGLDVLGRIHAADWRALGLGFLATSAVNPVGLDAQREHDERFLEWVAAGRELPDLEAARDWIARHVPDEGERVLVWGDARLGNLMYRDFAPVAVFDWEMATLGEPTSDLAWWLVFHEMRTTGIGKPNLPGFPDEAETVALYAGLSGRAVRNLHFYMVRAAFRAGMLLVRFTDAMIAAGRLHADAPRTPASTAYNVLGRLLADHR